MQWRCNLMKITAAMETGSRTVVNKMTILAAIGLAAMMLLTVGDVFGRYFFNRPIKGTWEVVGVLLVCAGTWGIAYCQLKKGHIRVDVLLARFPKQVRAIIFAISDIMGFVVFAVLCWQALLLAKRYYSLSSGLVTDTLEIPLYPFMLMLAIGAGAMALVLIVDLTRSLAAMVQK